MAFQLLFFGCLMSPRRKNLAVVPIITSHCSKSHSAPALPLERALPRNVLEILKPEAFTAVFTAVVTRICNTLLCTGIGDAFARTGFF